MIDAKFHGQLPPFKQRLKFAFSHFNLKLVFRKFSSTKNIQNPFRLAWWKMK